MELLTVWGDKAYYHDDVEGLLLAVPCIAEGVDYEDACELLCERGMMDAPNPPQFRPLRPFGGVCDVQ